MPTPTTVSDMLDRLRRSGLIPADRLDGFLAGLQTSGHDPATPNELLRRLVAAGMITPFHADRLAAGKYKGFQLGNYLILDQLGAGGMGQVYLAEHTTMRRLVALKVFPPASAEDDVARARFLREARAAATLDHPNIVRVFDLCQEGRLLYLVMEYVDGVSLQALVARHGPLDVTAACHYARQVAFGLQHAHELGFVHRDIKPANILLDRHGVVRILDFGLVRSEADAAAGLTRRLDGQNILGTADYVAPEQAVDSSSVDVRADLYSLGATLYYMLAGRTLFPEGRTAQKLVWQQIREPVPVNRLRPEVPPELAAVVHTLLRKRPEERYQTPAEVFDALAPWGAEDVPPPRESLMPTPAPRVLAIKAATSGPRSVGSTSQLVARAMRGGSGSMSGTHRPLPDGPSSGGPSTGGRESHVMIPRPRPGSAEGSGETDAVALGATQRTPSTPPARRREKAPPAAPPERPHGWRTAAVIAAAVAAILAVVVVILLMR